MEGRARHGTQDDVQPHKRGLQLALHPGRGEKVQAGGTKNDVSGDRKRVRCGLWQFPQYEVGKDSAC